MRKPLIPLLVLAAAVAGCADTSPELLAPDALNAKKDASGVHFQAPSVASILSNGALSVSVDEAGLGNGNVDYLLLADATGFWVCINGGQNHPKAANKESFEFSVMATASLQAKNGRIRADIVGPAPDPGDFSCPPGQRLELSFIRYANITLEDTTNGLFAPLVANWVEMVFFDL